MRKLKTFALTLLAGASLLGCTAQNNNLTVELKTDNDHEHSDETLHAPGPNVVLQLSDELKGVNTYSLSWLLNMTPVKVEITRSIDDKVIVIEDEAELNEFMQNMEQIVLHTDCLEACGEEPDVYTMKFTDAEGNVAEVSESLNVDTEYYKEESGGFKTKLTLGFAVDLEGDNKYSALLAPMFEGGGQ